MALPVASFTVTLDEFGIPTAIGVDGSGSTTDDDYVDVTWTFGDGFTIGPSLNTDLVKAHNYATAGTYVVTLTFKDDAGNVATSSQSVTVGSGGGGGGTPPPMSPTATVTAQLYDIDNLTFLMDLPSSYSRSVQDLANQVSTGAVTLPLTATTEIPAMTRNRYVRFYLDGVAVWSGRIRPRRQESVVAGEEGATNRSFALFSPLSEWSQSVLLPPLGTDNFPTMTNRGFGWFSREGAIRTALWNLASNVRTVFNDNTPLAYPYIFAWRIWGHPTAKINDGTDYFRYDFHLNTQQTIVFYVSAADNFDMYLNGAGVMTGDDAPSSSSDRTWHCIATLPAGDHCVAFRVHNISTVDAWLACSAFQCNPDGVTGALQLGTFVFTTGFQAGGSTLFNFRSQQYPADPIGVTVGMVIRVMLQEARARGRLLDWNLSCTDDVDTNGHAWDNIAEVQLPVGSSLSDCLIKLATVYCDFSVDVAGKMLNVHRWREMGSFATNTSPQVVYSSAMFGGNPSGRLSNILELIHQEHPDA